MGAAKAIAEENIRTIDSHEALGIVDDSSKWFVYWMTRKAHENSGAINTILAALRARLQVLAQEDLECPMCLEPISNAPADLDAEPSFVVLGCCHKVYYNVVLRGHTVS